MTRRSFFGALAATPAILATSGAAPADPLVPYARASNLAQYTFIRESERVWLAEALGQINAKYGFLTDVCQVNAERNTWTGEITLTPIMEEHDDA